MDSREIRLLAPEPNSSATPIRNLGFRWTSVEGATSYTFVLSPNANLSGALVSQEVFGTANDFAGPLQAGRSYYWQVKAWKDRAVVSGSPVGVFSTLK